MFITQKDESDQSNTLYSESSSQIIKNWSKKVVNVKNNLKSFNQYREAADAQNKLAIYENDEGKEKSLEKAFYMYEKATETNDADVQYSLLVANYNEKAFH
ncbi:2106_t:CDS:2 [Funneliformis geosporum]|uniref:2106_t:CDS:1 n=1 Tax=Funneliformis geosporum TaxID=1117311 RepID=A0A9W4WU20_9GLOM|nr:2106_t:CDS:2 [Funneliformis geosporum]